MFKTPEEYESNSYLRPRDSHPQGAKAYRRRELPTLADILRHDDGQSVQRAMSDTRTDQGNHAASNEQRATNNHLIIMNKLVLNSNLLSLPVTDLKHVIREVNMYRHVHDIISMTRKQQSQYSNEYYRTHKK